MKIRDLIFVDQRDKAHVDWINHLIKKGVKLEEMAQYEAAENGQIIGRIFDIKRLNPFKRKRLIEESNKFLGDDLVDEIIKF